MEEEREVLEDVSKTLKAKVIEDLIHYDLVEPCSNCYFLVGLNMKERKRTELVEFLMTNIEIFTWTSYEMPVIDPNFIKHKLNLLPEPRPAKHGGEGLPPSMWML